MNLIKNTVNFTKTTLANAEGGHDWFHIQRVWKLAKHIGQNENNVDMLVVELGAILHDIADVKFHNGDETIGPRIVREWLTSQGAEEAIIDHVEKIVQHISFKNGLQGQKWTSLELAVVQDADRLDAIGAIGIARKFNYGGFKGRTLFDPDIKPQLNMSSCEYKKNTAPSINHFYEKLLLLKDRMNTETGRRLAEDRHAFMKQFLEQFHEEWNGNR